MATARYRRDLRSPASNLRSIMSNLSSGLEIVRTISVLTVGRLRAVAKSEKALTVLYLLYDVACIIYRPGTITDLECPAINS